MSLLALLGDLKLRYRIPTANFLGHGDLAPARKVDPSRLFPWQRLASQGFGLWCDVPTLAVPAGFDAMLGLQALGYDIVSPAAARQAFRRHFIGVDTDADLTADEQSSMDCLLRKKISGDSAR